MKKIIVIFTVLILAIGCTKEKLATEVVSSYFNSYINLDKEVISSINKTIDNDDTYCKICKETYKEILKKQYSTLKYNIISEEYDDNRAIIKVNINVIDLKKAESDAQNELISSLDSYYNDHGEVNSELYYKSKYELMLKETSRVNYEINLYLEKEKGNWKLFELTDDDLMKIHGIY